MAAVDAEVAFFTGNPSSYDYEQVARQFQSAIADIAHALPHVCAQIPTKCSSDASIGVGYSHSGNGVLGSHDAEEVHEQTSRGSKRSAEALTFNQLQSGQLEDEDSAKRARASVGRMLSEEEKLERRREGNRKAAQRLRQRRMATVSNLQAEIARLEAERLVYLNHIYQLAASARSVVSENKALRARLEVLTAGAGGLDPLLGLGAAASAAQALALQHSAQSRPASSNAATSRMDFDAVRRELFAPGNASSAALWPFPGTLN